MADWKSLVKSVAPVLGAALGGPIAGTAVKYLADEMLPNSDKSHSQLERDLASVLQAPDTDTLAKLKELDQAFDIRMSELGVDVFKLEVQDRIDARAKHKDSIMPAVIVVMLTLLVAAGTWLLITMEVPEKNEAIIYMVFGQAMGFWGASIAYWVGTTKASNDKTKLIGAGQASAQK